MSCNVFDRFDLSNNKYLQRKHFFKARSGKQKGQGKVVYEKLNENVYEKVELIHLKEKLSCRLKVL